MVEVESNRTPQPLAGPRRIAQATGAWRDRDRAIEHARGSILSRDLRARLRFDEDPVTGSAHTALGPYWAGLLGKTEFWPTRRRSAEVWEGAGRRRSGQARRAAVTVMTGELIT